MFHHGVVDGDVFCLAPRLWREAQKSKIGLGRVQSHANWCQKSWGVLLERRLHIFRLEKEQSGIPQEISRLNHLRGALKIGLFDEAREFYRSAIRPGRLRQFKIPIGRFRMARRDAERHQIALVQSLKPL